MANSGDRAPVTITEYDGGPLLVRGDFELRRADGTVIDPGRATVALCRCGHSGRKPFCDGTHKVVRLRRLTGSQEDHQG
jgi:CDGSH-type Zn-finger protein